MDVFGRDDDVVGGWTGNYSYSSYGLGNEELDLGGDVC